MATPGFVKCTACENAHKYRDLLLFHHEKFINLLIAFLLTVQQSPGYPSLDKNVHILIAVNV